MAEERMTPIKEDDVNWRRKRVPQFIKWLKARYEMRIVAVSHKNFLEPLAGKEMKNGEYVVADDDHLDKLLEIFDVEGETL